MLTRRARFNVNRSASIAIIFILLIDVGMTSPLRDDAVSPNRIAFRDDEYPLGDGSVCKFQHNGTLGTCTSSPMCPVASYELQHYHIRPTTCSLGTKYPSVCCFGQLNGIPSFPTLPPHEWHPLQDDEHETHDESPSGYLDSMGEPLHATHFGSEPESQHTSLVAHGPDYRENKPPRKSEHCE